MKMKKVLLIAGAIAIASSVGVYANSLSLEVVPEKEMIGITNEDDKHLTENRIMTIEEATELGFVNKIDFNEKEKDSEDSEYQSTKINVNDTFYLPTSGSTDIGSENNIFAKTISIANSAFNDGNIRVEVRNSKSQLLGSVTDLKPGYSYSVYIPATSGTYTIQANASDISGYYNIVAYDK